MITFLTWLWGDRYIAQHVNTLARMVARHYPSPHRFVCVTNKPGGIDSHIEIVGDREDFAHVASPHGGTNPSCYRRLRLFEVGADLTFGSRAVNLDLDLVITGDLRPLFDGRYTDSFVGWQDAYHPHQINGSLWMVSPGLPLNKGVWEHFDPAVSPGVALAAGFKGSDQGWMSYCLTGARWTGADGIYSFKKDRCETLPAGARIVVHHGDPKPWSDRCQRIGWIEEHYR